MYDPNGFFNEALAQYARVEPRDLRDAEFFVNNTTFEAMKRYASFPPEDHPYQRNMSRMFGIPVRVDANLPDGVIKLCVETELDRAVRRAHERGQVINIMAPVRWPTPVPDPTLKALLKHWWKQWRKRRG